MGALQNTYISRVVKTVTPYLRIGCCHLPIRTKRFKRPHGESCLIFMFNINNDPAARGQQRYFGFAQGLEDDFLLI